MDQAIGIYLSTIALGMLAVCAIGALLKYVPLFPIQASRSILQEVAPPIATSDLLPAEQKHQTENHFATLATFRQASFSENQAVDEYHGDPGRYAIALAEVSKEVCSVVLQKCKDSYEELMAEEELERYWRYYAGNDKSQMFSLITFFDGIRIFAPWMVSVQARERRCESILGYRPLRYPFRLVRGFFIYLNARSKEQPTLQVPPRTEDEWMEQLKIFRKNILTLCKRVGSPAEDLAPPAENIRFLERWAGNRNNAMSPLFKENSDLKKTLWDCKNALTALQIRHNIEQLMNHLPLNTPGYPERQHISPRWEVFWEQMWQNAITNPTNPFYNLRQTMVGPYQAELYFSKGERLFSDMSAEIHGYNQHFTEYEGFDPAIRAIAKVLRPAEGADPEEIDWAGHLARFPYLPTPEIIERVDARRIINTGRRQAAVRAGGRAGAGAGAL